MTAQHGILIGLYFAIGIAGAAFVVYSAPARSARLAGSALTMVVLWPLWAPFALVPPALPTRGPLASRIAAALGHAAGADALLGPSESALLLRRVEVAERRLGELTAQLTALQSDEPAFDADGPDARARAQLRSSTILQLAALRDREHSALVELADLCELLRAQHLLSRFGGPERAGELRDELWRRVQALSELDECRL